MDIHLFHSHEGGWLTCPDADLPALVKNYTTRLWHTDIRPNRPGTVIQLSTKLINDRTQRHVDKWVEDTATHLLRYSHAGSHRPLLYVPSGRRNDRRVLKVKNFSGDVSGVIGESIFSSLLIEHFGLGDRDFAHFSAYGRKGGYPDFGIYTATPSLRAQLLTGCPVQPVTPIPAEVKTITETSLGMLRGRVMRAAEQLRNFWAIEMGLPGGPPLPGPSIICVVLRNTRRRSYDVAINWVH
jgi:hypothetical protein